ncbi:ANK-REP-REGION domain-containing protein [Mycena kentingensis (nom. inval.)]|nr:ANK-REP-REGION domain-containing protein [Mycena kentingensis (nom. inval.)]
MDVGIDMDRTYGAFFVGYSYSALRHIVHTIFISALESQMACSFQGVLTLQTYTYFITYPSDHILLKSLVAAVWLFDAVHLGLIAQPIYYYLVSNWGNAAALTASTTQFTLHMIFVALPSLACQFFFLYRIWMFSDRKHVLAGILAVPCIAAFAGHVAIVVRIMRDFSVEKYSQQTKEMIWAISSSASADLFIAAALVWYLQKSKSPGVELSGLGPYRRTDLLLAKVVQYTVATGFATSIFGFAVLATYLLSPKTFTFIGMYFSFGRMYTNALLVNLNARRSLRESIFQHTETVRISHLRSCQNPPGEFSSMAHREGADSMSRVSVEDRCAACGADKRDRLSGQL